VHCRKSTQAYGSAESARLIAAEPHLELAVEPELSVVVFRRPGWATVDYQAWSDHLLAAGAALGLPTSWHGEALMRIFFMNLRTMLEDVRILVDSMA
jgi:hypothetical protein